jgi:hypothetical protein
VTQYTPWRKALRRSSSGNLRKLKTVVTDFPRFDPMA